MKLSDDACRPTGRFVLDVFHNGALVEHIDEPNLIVAGYASVQAHLLGGSVAGNSVTQIGFGTNGTAPVPANNALTSAYTKALDSVIYPTASSVQFNFSLGSAEANGKALMEFGLITAGATLYARKVRAAALNKDTDISFSGSWTITFP